MFDKLIPGQIVTLAFDHGTTEQATFLGLEGEGDAQTATFETFEGIGQSYEWTAYLFEGDWAYGTGADRLSLVGLAS